MLDTAREIPTPEGIELNLRLAGPVARALAWAVDLLLRVAVFGVLGIPLAMLGSVGGGIYLILWFGLEWLYPTVFEVYFGGATPGKRALALMVLHSDGTPVGLSASLTRNLLRAVDFLPFLYGFGLLAMVLSRDFQRLGDIAGGTVVVYRETGPPARRDPTGRAPATGKAAERGRAAHPVGPGGAQSGAHPRARAGTGFARAAPDWRPRRCGRAGPRLVHRQLFDWAPSAITTPL